MKKIVVVSTNNNPQYKFFVPIVEWMWNKLGWDVCTLIHVGATDGNTPSMPLDVNRHNSDNWYGNLRLLIPVVPGLRSETIAQASRLYAASRLPDDALIMTSDMDMLPLGDHWKPNPDNITVYGHDLTWHSYFPMCYIAMTGAKWKQVMNLTGDIPGDMLRDAKETGMPFSNDWEQWWNHDWHLITERLKASGEKITHIERGQVDYFGKTSLAKGRVDRFDWPHAWDWALDKELIDCHCISSAYHEERWPRVYALIQKAFPGEDVTWMDEYRNEFVKGL